MNQLTDMPDAVVAGRIAIGVWMLMFEIGRAHV